MMRQWSALVVLVATGSAFGATLEPRDFARGITLETDPGRVIWEVTLPAEVYRTAVRADLGDLRVFNAEGEVVPHALHVPSALPWTSERIVLNLYPVDEDAAGTAPSSLTIDSNGTVVRIDTGGSVQAVGAGQIRRYIADTRPLRERQPANGAPESPTPVIDRLELELGATEGNFVAAVRVEQSQDLYQWQTLTTASVARIEAGSHSLRRLYVDLDRSPSRFLRLSWEDASVQAQISDVSAVISSKRERTPKEYLQLAATQPEPDIAAFEFDAGGHYRTDEVDLLLPEPNRVADAVIQSRNDAEKPWNPRHRGVFFQLAVQGQEIRGSPADIGAVDDRYWRVQLSGDALPDGKMPVLKLGWTPDKLTFLANGRGPYTLAFGSSVVKPPQQSVKSLLATLDQGQEDRVSGVATIAGSRELGGSEALESKIKIDRRKLVLWTVLVAGVLVLAGLALQLSSSIGSGRSTDMPPDNPQ